MKDTWYSLEQRIAWLRLLRVGVRPEPLRHSSQTLVLMLGPAAADRRPQQLVLKALLVTTMRRNITLPTRNKPTFKDTLTNQATHKHMSGATQTSTKHIQTTTNTNQTQAQTQNETSVDFP